MVIIEDSEERTYEQICELLRQEGWKEQRDGESNMNGVLGTNFMRSGCVITIIFNDTMDEEEMLELFGEANPNDDEVIMSNRKKEELTDEEISKIIRDGKKYLELEGHNETNNN